MEKFGNANRKWRYHVQSEIGKKGNLHPRQFEDETRVKRSFGWGSWGDVSRMMFHLFLKGEVMVVGRQGKQKLYGLPEDFLPSWVSKEELSVGEVEYLSAQRSLRALGIANSSEITWHFFRNRYPNLKATMKQLVADEKIIPVDIIVGTLRKGERYIHSKDIALLSELELNKWEQLFSLLSPFVNLI